jgi:hypothetical protein
VITMLFLLLNALDNPFAQGVGGLDPVAMERSLLIVDEELRALGGHVPIPCGPDGTPVSP